MINLRKATLTDVSGIAAVVYDVWAQNILADVCQAQIKDDACALWVAADGDDVAGFVSAFLTVGSDGARRWEVDLLAVRRASRGRRLGQKLVLAACRDISGHNVSVARAAIQVDNIASQRTFENAGFATDRRVHQLLLWTPKLSDDPDVHPKDVALLPVDTVTYRGLWIEGLTSAGLSAELQRDVVRTARSLVAREERLNTGALVPLDEAHLLAADLRNQASVYGEYYWFVELIPLAGASI